MRPSVGFAAIRLLEAAGCEVVVPKAQTCCGQPAYNSGEMRGARAIALQTIAAFEGYDYVVAPSGSCAAMLKLQPRRLLAAMPGLELIEMPGTETCCGFGGLFSVKFPDISNAMVSAKTKSSEATGAELMLSGELGCLLNVAGKLSRQGSRLACRHVAEVLAGEMDAPPLARSASRDAS